MEIRDPIHGSISILEEEVPIVGHRFFGRLRDIKQLGFAQYAFPGATHTRFLHSIGVMSVGEKVFSKIFSAYEPTAHLARIKETFKLACLLHDVGHAPLSHSTEQVMPPLSKLAIPKHLLNKNPDRQAHHEDYTIKSIADSSFCEAFERVQSSFGVERERVVDLIRGETDSPEYFSVSGIGHFPLLHQLISSELDCDRMDYLLRDSYFCGVSYGQFDIHWLIDNLRMCIIDDVAYLGISERAILTFNDFLIGRYHMFIMIYFHYRSICLENFLLKFFQNSPDEYKIPEDIESYQSHDDHFLFKILRSSPDPYAKRIVNNEIPPKIFESFNREQLQKLEMIQTFLEENNIPFIRCSSPENLSKYGLRSDAPLGHPIKVVREEALGDKIEATDIHEATSLFKNFRESHAVNRLHCDRKYLTPSAEKRDFPYHSDGQMTSRPFFVCCSLSIQGR